MVERDEKGRVRKGSALNPTGIDRRKAMMLRDLEALTPRAIARLGTLIDSDQPAIALGAAKEVLNRNLGVPKAKLDVTVEHSVSAMHLAALQALADKARQTEATIIDVTPESAPAFAAAALEIHVQSQPLTNAGSEITSDARQIIDMSKD